MIRAALAAVAVALLGACSGGAFSAGAGDAGDELDEAAAARLDAGAGDVRELDQVVDQVDAGDVVDAQLDEVLEATAAADVVDACALVTHADGFGQSFADCTPAGDYTEQLALDACEAFTKGTAAAACIAAACPQGPLVVCTSGLASSCACWVYGGANVGHAREGDTPADCPCDDMTDAGASTGWQ